MSNDKYQILTNKKINKLPHQLFTHITLPPHRPSRHAAPSAVPTETVTAEILHSSYILSIKG